MQRRVDEANYNRQAIHFPEKAAEVLALVRQKSVQGLALLGQNVCHDKLLDQGETLGIEKHVLGPAKSDALCAEFPRTLRVVGIVGVGPHLEPGGVVGPLEQLH